VSITSDGKPEYTGPGMFLTTATMLQQRRTQLSSTSTMMGEPAPNRTTDGMAMSLQDIGSDPQY
jgi:hypothetical protein